MSFYILQLFLEINMSSFSLLNYQKKILVIISISESMTKLASSCRINHLNPFGKLIDKVYTPDSMVPFLNCYFKDMI